MTFFDVPPNAGNVSILGFTKAPVNTEPLPPSIAILSIVPVMFGNPPFLILDYQF